MQIKQLVNPIIASLTNSDSLLLENTPQAIKMLAALNAVKNVTELHVAMSALLRLENLSEKSRQAIISAQELIILPFVIQLQRSFHAQKASKKLHGSPFWARRGEGPSKSASEASVIRKQDFFLKRKSAENLRALREEVAPSKKYDEISHNPDSKTSYSSVSVEEKRFLRFFMSVPIELTHYTKHLLAMPAIVSSGKILSYDKLNELGIKFQTASQIDIKELGNSDYVFFRMELIHQPRYSKFGDVEFLFDGRTTDLLKHGFVSLFEMLKPTTASICGRLFYKGEAIRQAVGSYKGGVIDLRYKNTQTPLDLGNTVFYGPDIMEGVALAFVREVRRIGGEFQKDFTRLFENHRIDDYQQTLLAINCMLSQLFRLEAKIPSVVYLQNAKVKIHDFVALETALKSNDLEKIKGYLSNHNADPILSNILDDMFSPVRQTAITIAIEAGSYAIVNLLLEHEFILDPLDKPAIERKFVELIPNLSNRAKAYLLKLGFHFGELPQQDLPASYCP